MAALQNLPFLTFLLIANGTKDSLSGESHSFTWKVLSLNVDDFGLPPGTPESTRATPSAKLRGGGESSFEIGPGPECFGLSGGEGDVDGARSCEPEPVLKLDDSRRAMGALRYEKADGLSGVCSQLADLFRWSAPQFKDTYRKGPLLGDDPCGSVFLCQSLSGKGTYVVKTKKPGILDHETKLLSQILHKNVIRVENSFVGQDGKVEFLVLERSFLGDCIKNLPRINALNLPGLQSLLRQISEAVHFLHSHEIAHRDIKPDNIVLFEDSAAKSLIPKLIDFEHSCQGVQISKSRPGTPDFAAPEILSLVLSPGGVKVFPADVWATGVTLFALVHSRLPWEMPRYMLAGKAPRFSSRNPRSLTDLLSRMLERNVEARITMEEVIRHKFFAPLQGSKAEWLSRLAKSQ